MKKRVLVALLCISVGISGPMGVPVAEASVVNPEQTEENVISGLEELPEQEDISDVETEDASEETANEEAAEPENTVLPEETEQEETTLPRQAEPEVTEEAAKSTEETLEMEKISRFSENAPEAVMTDVKGANTVTLNPVQNADAAAVLEAALKEVEKSGTTEVTTIVIPAGTYKWNEAVSLVSNVNIVATGATINASANIDTMLRTVSGRNTSNVTVEGGTWNCGKKAESGFIFYTGKNITLKNCTVNNGKGNGVRIGDSSITLVEGCTISGNAGSGIYATGNTVISAIKGCTISSNGATGMTASGITVSELSNTVFSGNGEHGLAVYNKAKANNIVGVKAEKNKEHGIAVTGDSQIKIAGATAEGNTKNGVSITGDKSKAVIEGLTTTKNKGTGIAFSKCGESVFKNSKVTYNGGHGVTISDTVVDMACTKQTANTVENNDWSGVSITGKDSKVTIKCGNYSKNGRNPKSSSEGESGHGVGVFSGATLVLKEATMKDNSVCGVSPFGAGTSATIEKCVIQDNGRHGIGGRKSVTLTVKGNTIKDNKNHGIMVNDKSNGKNIENNEISGNKQCGICVGVRSKATVKNNNISKSGQNAIYVYDKSKATITGGKLQSNKECGVVTDKNADVTVKKVNISKNKIYGMNIKGGKAKVQSCTISSNKSSGIQVKAKAKVSELSGNKIKNNGEYGIYCKEASVNKIEKNTITGHKKYGIVLYPGSTCKNIKKNTLSNPAAPKEIGIQGSTSNVGDVKPVTISTAKKNGTSIKGSAPSNAKVSVKIGKKTYSAKAGGNGSYTIKTAKLKKGTKLKVQATAAGGNTVYAETVVK